MSLSLGRRFISDLLHAGMQIPLVTVQKDMHLAELVALRRQANPKPSWCSIFTKAYATVVAARPDMRRAYLSFPWERLYEYRSTSADIAMEVNIDGENVLAFVPIKHPQQMPLAQIDRMILEAQAAPLERLNRYRRARILARFPRVVRRFVWWALLNVHGELLADHFSTFGVTSVGNWGVESIRPIAPAISILHYGAIDSQGKVVIRMTYDHRVLDGSGPSKALNEMEAVLKGAMIDELRSLGQSAEIIAKAG